MMAYLQKSEYKKIVIVVNRRQEAYALNKKLMMESKTSINLFDFLSQSEFNDFVVEEMMDRCD